jgi:hypothetical protein
MSAYYNEHDKFNVEWLKHLMAAGMIAPGEIDGRDIQDVRAEDLRGFTQCHFFAGIGVWSYSLRLAGWPEGRMSGKITVNVEPSEAQSVREQCAKIAAIEAQYWGEVEGERMMHFSIGAMGAAANICAAILDHKTPEQHKAECDQRGKAKP